MNWEELTSPEFEDAVETCGKVCAVPIGVIERHGDHLPLGTDSLKAQYALREAARLEPLMVFPLYYFGQNTSAKCAPGAIAIKFKLLLELLESICDEIARNGFNKILLYSSHGGNSAMLDYFRSYLLDTEKPYSIFVAYAGFFWMRHPVCISKSNGHGGEAETSIMMAMSPDLVKGQPGTYGMSQGRNLEFAKLGCNFPGDWYGNHPGMLSCDSTCGSADKGEALLNTEAQKISELVRLIKCDHTPAEIYHEYHCRSRNPLAWQTKISQYNPKIDEEKVFSFKQN